MQDIQPTEDNLSLENKTARVLKPGLVTSWLGKVGTTHFLSWESIIIPQE